MMSSNESIFRVTGHLCGEFTGPGEFPAQRPVTRSFDVCFDLRLNKRLSKQSWGCWFETPSRPFWRHNNVQTITNLGFMSARGYTHRELDTPYGVRDLGQHWFRQWFVSCNASSRYPIQSWLIDNWTPVQKTQWNFKQNANICFSENTFENVVCRVAVILSQSQCVNRYGNECKASAQWIKNLYGMEYGPLTDAILINQRVCVSKELRIS